MYALLFRIRHLRLRLLQPLLQALFILRAAASEALFEDLEGGRGEEEEAGVEVGAFDLFDAL
jgi:hypothetical protein